MRFFSSSAFASAEKLRLAANCSAAETMVLAPNAPNIPAIAPCRLDYPLTGKWKRCTCFASPAASLRPSRRSGFLWCEYLDRSARLLNRRDGGFGCAVDGKLQRHLDFTSAEQANPVLGAPQHLAPDQGLDVDRVAAIERATLDSRLDAIEVHHVELEREYIVETALRQSPMQRHLSTLEALDAHAGACSLTLAAATASLALPGPDTAADAHAPLAGPRVVGNLIELHGAFPFAERGRPARSRFPQKRCGRDARGPSSLFLLNHA